MAALTDLPANVRGALWILTTAGVVVVMGATIKMSTGETNTLQMVFMRGVVATALLLPVVWRASVQALRTRRIGVHFWRGAVSAASNVGLFYSFVHLPLAEATTYAFTKPMFLTLMAVLLLGERVDGRRWIATLIGFAGIIVILRPGLEAVQPAALAGIGAALGAAVVIVLIKRMVTTESATAVLFYSSLFSMLTMAPAAAVVWQPPPLRDVAVVSVAAACAVLSQYFNFRAMRIAEASAVIPFDYFRLPLAGLLGYWLFGEVPDVYTLIGAALIIGATLDITLHSARS
ncbi:MAG: DMT family transporter [Acetobacterales bacterium]